MGPTGSTKRCLKLYTNVELFLTDTYILGVIIEYELMMRGSSGSDGIHRPLQRRIFRSSGAYDPRSGSNNPLNPPMNNYTITGLKPFKEYQFLVSSSNKLGSTESPWISARTLEGSKEINEHYYYRLYS